MANENILVIGGGPAGMEAARGIADLGYKAILVEKRDRLGGTPDEAQYAALTPDLRNAEEAIGEMIAAVTDHPNVQLLTGTEISACNGEAGDFTITAVQNGKDITLEVKAPPLFK